MNFKCTDLKTLLGYVQTGQVPNGSDPKIVPDRPFVHTGLLTVPSIRSRSGPKTGPPKNMASDRGQNRQSDFVASESLIVVVFLASWRDLSLFVSSSFPVSSHCFLRGAISVSSCRQVSRFVELLSSRGRRRLLCFVVLFSSWRHSSLRVVVFFVSSTTV